MIEIFDNCFTEEESYKLYKILLSRKYQYGETDNEDTPPTGVVFDIGDSDPLHQLFISKIEECGSVFNIKFDLCFRSYVNLFLPNERPYFHTDGNVITCLFYFNPKYGIDEGGETQFIIDGDVRGIFPEPGRLVVFDGTILHRATSYRNKPRITVAVKFGK
jgi:hypothetical protein